VLKIGLLVNPRAGIGGTVALKGSDDVYEQALAMGGEPRGAQRTLRALERLGSSLLACHWLTWGGVMGEDCLRQVGVEPTVLGTPAAVPSAADTAQALEKLSAAGMDLLVFAGGDGTARDVLEHLQLEIPVLGIPAGVKMHSGVFATTPERAGELLRTLITGGLVQSAQGDVRDLDESELRQGRLAARFFGELKVPLAGGYLQHTKESGRENEALAVEEIVAEVIEQLAGVERPVVLGPGSTLLQIKSALQMHATLLGMDVWQQGKQIGQDVTQAWLDANLSRPIVILSFTRGQGFLLGRGNQQLSVALLSGLRRQDLWVVGTRSKLKTLEGRPLLVDTNDPALDETWCGLIEIITGYADRLWYRVDCHA
jgi:predicted polyphosphate/ATP-dependent NAD kinase